MAGIINDSNAVQQGPAQGMKQLSPAAVRAAMTIPPELQDAYQRIVLAGRKIMYSPQMADQIKQLLAGPGAVSDKIAQGVVTLMGLILNQSNHTLPPKLIIPCTLELVTEAAELLRQAGLKVTDQDIAAAMASAMADVLQKVGVTPDQLGDAARKGAAMGNAPSPKPAPQPPQAAPAPTGA